VLEYAQKALDANPNDPKVKEFYERIKNGDKPKPEAVVEQQPSFAFAPSSTSTAPA
jgi:hypothetical protein